MCESVCIHLIDFHIYRFSGNLNSFLDLISTYSLSNPTKLEQDLCFNVHIHILEIHNL